MAFESNHVEQALEETLEWASTRYTEDEMEFVMPLLKVFAWKSLEIVLRSHQSSEGHAQRRIAVTDKAISKLGHDLGPDGEEK